MKKEEFMEKLEYLLQDVNEEEREAALTYYRDYLDEAGPENEEKAIEDFGSPERVAAMIRAGISGAMEDGGEFTESGYEDERFRDPNFQLQKRLELPEEKTEKKQEERKRGPVEKCLGNINPILRFVLILLLIVVAVPPLLETGTGALSFLAWTAVSICLLFLFIGLIALCLLLGGIAAVAAGTVTLIHELFLGLLLIGGGLLMAGAGCFTMILAVWFYGTALPWLFRKAGDLCDRIFHQKRRQGV